MWRWLLGPDPSEEPTPRAELLRRQALGKGPGPSRSCLVCQAPLSAKGAEGQLCQKCVEAGHRVTDDTLYLNIEVKGPDPSVGTWKEIERERSATQYCTRCGWSRALS